MKYFHTFKNILPAFIVLIFTLIGLVLIYIRPNLFQLIPLITVAIPFILFSLINIKIAFYISIIFSFFIFHIGRLSSFPVGVVLDACILMTLIAVLIGTSRTTNWDRIQNPITWFFLAWVFYIYLEAFNTNIRLQSWFPASRVAFLAILYIVVFHIFTDYRSIIQFLKFVVVSSLIVALYAFHQEFIGLLDFERKWVLADPERYGLIYIGGRFRKWSFLGAVSDFGLFMAYCSIIIIIIALYMDSFRKKVVLFSIGIIELMAMTFSGTRTAYAMIFAGVFFYAILTVNQLKTIIFLIGFVFIIAILYFGPFYGKNINRLRTTLEFSQDASFNVREFNRKRIQPYIHSHPFGGGLFTTGGAREELNPGHPLAGFPPDSFFLMEVLQKGWVGLLITLSFFATILIVGIKGYFQVKSNMLKGIYTAFLSGFFALNIAGFAQMAILQKPMVYIVICSWVIMIRLKDFASNG